MFRGVLMKIFAWQDLKKLVSYVQVLNAVFIHEGKIFINIINTVKTCV